jgi:hypothetical protein
MEPGGMTVIGYARVSTTDQDLSIQEAVLRAASCDTVRAEKPSGSIPIVLSSGLFNKPVKVPWWGGRSLRIIQ